MSSPAAIPEQALPILDGTPIAFVTTMRPDGHMSTNPVAVIFDGESVRFSTTTDRRKYRNLLHDDRLTLCVVQPANLNKYVELRGRAVLAIDHDRGFIDSIARRYMGVDRYPLDPPGQERVTVTLVHDHVSCPQIPLDEAPPYQ